MLTYAEIAQAANAAAPTFAPWALSEKPAQKAGNTLRFRADSKLSVFLSGPKRGKWIDFSSGERGDMLDLLMQSRGLSKSEAAKEAAAWLGIDEEHRPAPVDTEKLAEEARLEELARIDAATKIWTSAHGSMETVKRYLASRGITMDLPACVRARRIGPRGLQFMDIDAAPFNGWLDAAVFGATDPHGKVRAVQQVLLHHDQKAQVAEPKRTRGALIGSAIRMGRGETVVVSEGPETGLSIRQATGLPTTIALGAGLLWQAKFPSDTKHLVIAADCDKAGLAVAAKAQEIYQSQGYTTDIVVAPEVSGCAKPDFNDVLRYQGEDAVRGAFARYL